MKKHFSTICLILIFLIGLSLLLYPAVSNYWNSKTQSRAIVNYDAAAQNLTPKDYSAFFDKADDYNGRIRTISYPFMNHDQVEGYWDTLDITGTGIMGYITIDKIRVELPIYHGTSDAVLNSAVGHMEGSSLPVGGESTHCVLSAHRGLPSAKLFTDLDKLVEGDTFVITILNRVLTYEIDRIEIVTPDQVDSLYVTEGEDHCTLVTCTPYGINTHRLLVRGTRTENPQRAALHVPNEAYRVDPIVMAPIVAVPMLLVLLVVLLIKYRKKPEQKSDIGGTQ